MSGTIFSICVTSAISEQLLLLRISALPAAQKRWRKGCKKDTEKKELWQSRSRRQTWFRRLKQVLRLCWVQMHPTVRGYSEHLVRKVDSSRECGETRSERLKSKWRSVEFSSVAKRCRKGRESSRRLVATRTNQDLLNVLESSQSMRRLAALRAENSESIDGNDTVWPHNIHTSTAYVSHLESVFSNVQQKFGRKPRHSSSRSSSWKRLCGEFTVYQKSVSTNIEKVIQCVGTVDQGSEWNPRSIRDQLAAKKHGKGQLCLLKKAVQLSNAKKTCVRLSIVKRVKTPSKLGKRRTIGFIIHSKKELDRIDGVPMEFEWKIFPGFTTLQILAEIQNMMTEIKCEPELFQGRIIIMSMYSDIVWWEKRK